MSFMIKNKVVWRTLVLVLFLISMLGPWAFDLLNVPAQYPCNRPSVRLYGDFCGYPMSGFQAFLGAVTQLFFVLGGLAKGSLAMPISELIFLLFPWLIVLPFFSTVLLLIWNTNSRRLQILNLVLWGIAGLLALTAFYLQTNRDQLAHLSYLLWGIWLYLLGAISTIIFEILVLRSGASK